MSTASRLLTLLAVVAACVVAIPASAVVINHANTSLAGYTDYRLSDNADNIYPTTGDEHGSSYVTPSLTDGTFTIQGRKSAYTWTTAPPASVQVTDLAVSNGNVVITGYFPRVTTIQFAGIRGTAKANTPMIDMSTLVSGYRVVVQVINSTVAWSNTETVANTQVLLSIPSQLSSATGVFALGVGLTRASAAVSVPIGAASFSMRFSSGTVVAVDYIKCNGCTNGIVYAPSYPIFVLSNSMLRVSHITFTPAATVPLVSAGSGSISVDSTARLVVENVTAPSSTIFAGSLSSGSSGSSGSIVLRYLNVSAIGMALGTGATYTDVAVQSGGDALASATHVVGQCPAACLYGFSLAAPLLSCSCACSSTTVSTPGSDSAPLVITATTYENFCTLMGDPLTGYVPTGCMDGCIACHNESACTACSSGYTLNPATAVCDRNPVTCPANCATCSVAGICTKCNSGYALSNTGACVRCTVANCKQCTPTNPDVCTLCMNDAAPVSNVCLLSCTDPHCVSCPTAPGTCQRCADGYGLVNGVCTACADPHCKQCDGNTTVCSACDNGYLPTGTGCSSSSGTCNVPDCLVCNATDPTKCVKCVSPTILDSVTQQCFLSGACSVANCEKCSATSASLCETCKAGYLPSTDMKTCSATASSTSTPTGGCRVPNCQTCVASNPDTCQTCNNGYYVSNGQCVLTGSCYVENCAQCMLRDSSKCSTCRNGYLLSSTFTCLSQHVSNGAAAPHSLWVAAAVLLASALTYLA